MIKRITSILISLFISIICNAQINITPFISKDIINNYPDAARIFENKLNNILTTNNIKSQIGDSRFILTGNWVPEAKNIISSSPIQIVYILNIHLYIGDGITGTKYISEIFRVKGVGATEEKAYLSAIKNLNVYSDKLSKFIQTGNSKILSYYEINRNKLFDGINTLIKKQDYNEAIYQLSLIPMECSYYAEVAHKLDTVYQIIIDNEAAKTFTEAKAIWAAKQDLDGASQAASLIKDINTHASCYNDIQLFIKDIKAKVNTIREQEYADKQAELAHRREVEMHKLEIQREINRQNAEIRKNVIHASERLQSERINAAREIAKEYARNRPSTIVYRINNWL